MTIINQSIQQAQDEKTPSETLAKLARVEDRLIRQYVASNPNTCVKTLKKLALEFPNLVMANPVLDLLILESNSITKIKTAIAKSSNVSEEVLNRLKDDSEPCVRYAVARNPKTPSDTLNYLKGDSNVFVRRAAALSPNPVTHASKLRHHDMLMLVKAQMFRSSIARSLDLPDWIIDYVEEDPAEVIPLMEVLQFNFN